MAEWTWAKFIVTQIQRDKGTSATTLERTMVVNRGDIKRKRKDDSCFSMLDESPKRTKVHAQRKFAQGSNVSSPVITPVKEIERQERNKDVLPEPIELLPMKRPNTEDFLTFLCFRGTPILPSNLNFFNTASMMDSQQLKNSEPKTTYPKNGPILTTSPSKCQNEKPFVAFGVRKRADPIVISKQMDRKRRHALALQALRRKYQEQKMAKIRAVTISKLSEKVTNKNVVRTRSVTKNEIASKKSIMHKTNIKVISTKRITTKTAIKQPVKSKMCLRSFRGRYIHRELNIKSHRKRAKGIAGPQRALPSKIADEQDEKYSSEFSSDDDEPLMKSVKQKLPKKPPNTQKQKKSVENTIRLTRSHNKLLQSVQSQQRKQTLKHRRIITRLSSTMTPSNQRIKSKIVQSSSSNIIRNLRRSVNNIKRTGSQSLTRVIRSTRQRIVKNTTEKKSVQTRSKSDKIMQKERHHVEAKKMENTPPNKKNTTTNIEKVIKKNEKTKIEIKTKIVKKKEVIKSPPTVAPKKADKPPIDKPPTCIKSTDDKVKPINNKPKLVSEKVKPASDKSKLVIEKNVKIKTKEMEQSPPPSANKRKVNTIKKAIQKISNSRPSRKTKEAAAIYMELLGHKLVNDTEVDDDDESIDSFPELPNVRRTEQRENELKAKAKSKDVPSTVTLKEEKDGPVKRIKGAGINEKSRIENEPTRASDKAVTCPQIKDQLPPKKASIQEQKCQKSTIYATETINLQEPGALDDEELLRAMDEQPFDGKRKHESKNAKELNPISDSIKTPLRTVKRQLSVTESDIDKAMALMLQRNPVILYNDSESPESLKKFDPKSDSENTTTMTKPQIGKKTSADLDQTFSESDEEPLSNLTKSKEKTFVRDRPTIDTTNEQQQPKMIEKAKRDCAKKAGHNYLPFSSSDDEEKYFHGFKTELKSSKIGGKPESIEKCPQHSSLPSSDLSCKDVSRRFGKGKVNMSNEQIEKWLNDSAMAGMTIKKEDDDILKYEEEKLEPLTKLDPTPPPLTSSPENVIKTEDKNSNDKTLNANRENDESLSLNSSTPEKNTIQATPTPPKITPTSERKTIFKKEKSEPVRNVNAFSASNECSVYAFEADTEDSTSISTPFRRPCRRPSSTATSKSEDDGKITEDIAKHSTAGKFRFPAVLRGDYRSVNRQDSVTGQPIQEDSTTQSTNMDVHTFTDTSNSEPPSIIEDISDQQIFCASTSSSTGQQQQSNKNQSPPDISCAKLIFGKTPPSGGSLHKIHSKLKAIHQQQQQKKAMFPPATLHKGKNDDVKYKIPSSPSASSSSSAKLVNRRQPGKTRNRSAEAAYTPVINVAEFPSPQPQQVRQQAQIVEAPAFHPTEKEFQDPLDYIEKIRGKAEKFGICRIIPPANFKPECKVSDDMRFTAYNQYVNKLLHRWGPNFKELMAIRKYLETQKITLTHPPWIGGMEIDLPRLYQTVQSLGGLKEVIEKKKWSKVSEAMKIPKSAQDRVTKLDDIYCKYLLPYDTLSPAEREKLFDEVETEWAKRESKTLLKVQRLSSGTDGDSDSDNESEECIVKGRNVALNAFYRIARNTMSMWFRTIEPSAEEVEQEFWKHVTLKNNHICVHSGSIDSGNWGYGFAVSKNSPFARHAWNLKVLTNNSGSVLRSMGPVMGVTVPTLHVGMVFSACCWYRDPHRLPWIEYLHTGAHKIWYGIPDSMSERFHASLLKLVPNYCRNKSIWLPSDTVMVPPKLLVENGVSLCRTVQEPGQFVVVFPKVFTSSVSTGYVVSESVYFAPSYWLKSAQNVFDELRKNCEPSMFSIDRLLLSITSDTRSSLQVLKQVMPAVKELCDREKRLRQKLRELGLTLTEKLPPPEVPAVRKRRKLQQRQDNNGGDYECEICRANLFISLVNEYQEDVIYCLEHVIEYIEQKKIDVKNCKLLFTYECEELDLLLEKLRNTIDIKQQKKAATKAGALATQ